MILLMLFKESIQSLQEKKYINIKIKHFISSTSFDGHVNAFWFQL